jgi:hypothetical protein
LHVLPPCGGAGGAFAQITWPENYTKPGWVYQGLRGRDYLIPKVAADSASLPTYPLLWTNGTRRDSSRGALAWTIAENKLWKWNGTAWSSVGGTVSGSSTDTTSLSNRINLKLNISDTAGLRAKEVFSFAKNAGRDSAILTLFDGTRLAVRDSIGGGGGSSTEYVVSGLGIKVDSSGRAYTLNSDTANASVLSRQRAANTYAQIGASPTGSGASPRVAYWSGASALTSSSSFAWNNTSKALYFDGVTPSAWNWTGANGMALEAPQSSLLLSNDYTYLNGNAYFDGAWKRKILARATNLYIGDGLFSIRSAASAAANSVITWLDRLYMTNDGRFGMNTTTTTAAQLTVTAPSAVDGIRVNTTGNASGINIQGTTVGQMIVQATTNTGISSITLGNDQAYSIAAGTYAIYGSNYVTADLRNQVAFGSRQGLLFQSNATTSSGGTNPIDFHTGGSDAAARFARMKSLSMSMNSAGSAADPVASAILDINSTTKGFLPPRMTTVQRNLIASPAAGLIIFCTDCTATDGSTGVSQTYSSSTWKNHY